MDELTTLQQAVPLLLAWFRENKRDLPWRHDRTFYTSLVAELMLQQTRVEAVKGKYVAFLEKFPTEKELALATEDEVMKAWEGLGYYTRARNLKKAAETLFREGTPRTWVGVNALAGVGNYTAGALCSIALGLREPAVDGNVLRILSRLFADTAEVGDGMKSRYSDLLRAVYPDETADFCEGLMELGAIVCLPNGTPLCESCPWETLCRAHREGMAEAFPRRAEKKARRVEYLNVYVLKCGDKYALRKRETGLLKGLWEFPNEIDQASPLWGEAPPQAVVGNILAQKSATHIFTHVEWHMTGYLIGTETRPPAYTWATADEIGKNYAIPSAFRAFRLWLK